MPTENEDDLMQDRVTDSRETPRKSVMFTKSRSRHLV